MARITGQGKVGLVGIVRSDIPGNLPADVAWRKVNNYESQELASAFSGCSTLIHLADGADRTNGAISDHKGLIRAIASSSISHVILASSIYAKTDKKDSENQYGNRKRQLEDALKTIPNIAVTAFRLPPVYGPGCKGGFATLATLLKKGWPLPIKTATELRDYIAVQNVTDLFIASLETGQVEPFTLIEPSDGQPISTADLAIAIADAIEQPARLFAVPNGVLRGLGRVSGKQLQIDALMSTLRVSHSVEEVASMTGGWRPSIQMPESLSFLKS